MSGDAKLLKFFVMMRAFAIFLVFSSAAYGQTAEPPAFEIADVHTSAHSNTPFMHGGSLRGDRYLLHQATMVDMIAAAYGVDPSNVLGGPSWLEWDRFDVTAKAPATTPPETVKLMLRSMLAERFKLVVHTDTKPLPAFVLAVGKGKLKMKEADGKTDSGCQNPPQDTSPGTIPYSMYSCHNVNMETFAQDLHDWARDYLTHPVVDQTGLKGGWDFDIKWTWKGALARAGADGIDLFDAVDKQLGLKLEQKTAPLPVIAVDSVNEKPTANPSDLEQKLPPHPPAEFDVAVIKPSAPGATFDGRGRIAGGQVNVQGITLQVMIIFAWDINEDMLTGAPKWLNSDHFDIIAKSVATGPNGPLVDLDDPDDLRQMIRTLLEERFKMVSHMEDRPVDAYTLMAVNPKLKKADPANHTLCKDGPGADGKDPRIANPILGRLISCQNMTMKQFGEQLQSIAPGYIKVPVLDATGLEGAWDFTLSFSRSNQLQGGGQSGETSTASDPSGAISLFDAIKKQLGLKLEKQKRPVPVLVIDHIDEKPTEN